MWRYWYSKDDFPGFMLTYFYPNLNLVKFPNFLFFLLLHTIFSSCSQFLTSASFSLSLNSFVSFRLLNMQFEIVSFKKKTCNRNF